MTGVVSFEFCGTTFNQVVGTATISGLCGTSVVIHYVDTLGQRGDFIGNVPAHKGNAMRGRGGHPPRPRITHAGRLSPRTLCWTLSESGLALKP